MNPRNIISAPSAAFAFTLIELLVVITIIGILAAITIPVAGRVRESARTATCQSNLRQTGNALWLFINDNKSRMPVSHSGNQSWQNDLRPYLTISEHVKSSTLSGGRAFLYCPTYEKEPAAHNNNAPGQWNYEKTYLGYKWNGCIAPDYRPKVTSVELLEPAATVVCWDAKCLSGWDRGFPNNGWGGGSYVEFAYRHGNKSHFLFLDGHVKGFASGTNGNPLDYPGIKWDPLP
ncbi:MAG: prepilin-type N-terminal cleavage/methylation domain-containing protein [Opitutaceae bacterium]|jgi:prepilin-type N-terminal cleavage/methylation domain-containing protein/prepilin-type processing-associated H-X9-DG protein|nr:prepilin-type N-terminal cleavage/methylation domain-containing protein [Opitutaceae bacterium]